MIKDDITGRLQKAGLSEKAAIIYAALLERGGAYPSALSEATHLNRSTVYKILLDLSVQGLVTEVERGKKLYYQIEKPEKLLRYSRERVDIAQDELRKAEELVPELEGIFAENPGKPIVRFYEDRSGIVSIYDDMLSEKRYEMVSFSHGQAFKNYLPKKDLYRFVKTKEKNHITTRAIIPDIPENRAYNETVFKGIKKDFWPDIRFVPKEMFPFEAEITLYGQTKLAITKLRDERMVGIVIDDKFIHDMFKMIFEIAWESKTLTK